MERRNFLRGAGKAAVAGPLVALGVSGEKPRVSSNDPFNELGPVSHPYPMSAVKEAYEAERAGVKPAWGGHKELGVKAREALNQLKRP